ncbi:MAG: glutamine-hydrolyzing GMP synthase [Nanoarchaeota archaeon]|nr:MAG: glutamine-hydrolyzing GMP synthase [Nanoarchaeota archaeon]
MILVFNFGGQYCHLIARRIRDMGYEAIIVLPNISYDEVQKMKVDGIILSGSPASVIAKDAILTDKRFLEMGVPVLGICYGHQLIARLLRGVISGKRTKEYGKQEVSIKAKSKILAGTPKKQAAWMSHGDTVEKLPNGFSAIGSTKGCQFAAFSDEKNNIFGVQFHPEVVHTKYGGKILKNFVNLTGAKKNWKLEDKEKLIIDDIKNLIGGKGVIMGVSGGVDSLVASVLISKATKNIHCVFVDHGLCRKNEAEYAVNLYRKLGINLHVENAGNLFLSRLKGITNPEQKRKIIGNTFIEVFDKKVSELKKKYKDIEFLGQGTIYPDRIESAQPGGKAAVIKTHHNVGGLPEKMKLKLVEPLADLYKDEVRKIGEMLGLKKEWVWRHPFPGPGLAVRILGEITSEKLRIVREADYIFIEELKKSGYYFKTWQAFAALLPIKSVGVMGDERTYDNMIALRTVTSTDAMTADWARLPHELLEKVSSRIVNEVRGINRVVYDVTQKPPATIEYE